MKGHIVYKYSFIRSFYFCVRWGKKIYFQNNRSPPTESNGPPLASKVSFCILLVCWNLRSLAYMMYVGNEKKHASCLWNHFSLALVHPCWINIKVVMSFEPVVGQSGGLTDDYCSGTLPYYLIMKYNNISLSLLITIKLWESIISLTNIIWCKTQSSPVSD